MWVNLFADIYHSLGAAASARIVSLFSSMINCTIATSEIYSQSMPRLIQITQYFLLFIDYYIIPHVTVERLLTKACHFDHF